MLDPIRAVTKLPLQAKPTLNFHSPYIILLQRFLLPNKVHRPRLDGLLFSETHKGTGQTTVVQFSLKFKLTFKLAHFNTASLYLILLSL